MCQSQLNCSITHVTSNVIGKSLKNSERVDPHNLFFSHDCQKNLNSPVEVTIGEFYF